MKQKLYYLGLVTTAVVFLGTVFKVNHYPGAGILLTLGISSMAVIFFPLALINSFRGEDEKFTWPVYFATGLTILVVFTGMLFKIMHWPYAGVMLTVAMIFPYLVFLPVFIIVSSKDKNYSIYNTVSVLSLLTFNAVFSALLALNVSKDRIDDSLVVAGNYNRVEASVAKLRINQKESPVISKINNVLAIIDEYQAVILKEEKLTENEWTENSHMLMRPDSRNNVNYALSQAQGLQDGAKLENGLKDLFSTLESTPGYEVLAKDLPAILDLGIPEENDRFPIEPMFAGHYTAWTLIYLDAMETSLGMIKATL